MEADIIARGEDPALFPILNSKPEIFRDLIWIWEAYMILSSSRQTGMSSPQPIQISEILSYALYEGISGVEDRTELMHHVQYLDRVFRADWAARNPNNKSNTPPPSLGAPQ